jgi:hypothetical protein
MSVPRVFHIIQALLALCGPATAYSSGVAFDPAGKASPLPAAFRPPPPVLSNHPNLRQSYDLGLGRNPPFRQQAAPSQDRAIQSQRKATAAASALPPPSCAEATQYLVEHEGQIEREKFMVPLPGQPATPIAPALRSSTTNTPTRHSKSPPSTASVVGRRITDDSVLHIVLMDDPISLSTRRNASQEYSNSSSSSSTNRPPLAHARGYEMTAHYDLNTVWVEMLIHSEQHRAALAIAAAAVSVG